MRPNPKEFRAKLSVAPSGERWALVVGRDGLAHDRSTLYGVVHLRGCGYSYNTQMHAMQTIALVLNWCRARCIDIDRRTDTCELLSLGELSALRDRLRINLNTEKAKSTQSKTRVAPLVSNNSWYSRLILMRDYLTWHAEQALSRMSDPKRRSAATHNLEQFRKKIDKQLPTTTEGTREGITEEQEIILLNAITPGHPLNPFPKKLQARNEIIVLLYSELGDRRAETLKIKCHDLTLEGQIPMVRITVRNDEADDPRAKEPRAKTMSRELPISKRLAAKIKKYILSDRSKLPGAKKTPYLILARTGEPMALQTVGDIFRQLRERVPGLPEDFVPHMLRHRWNDRFYKHAQDVGKDPAKADLEQKYAMAWKKNSNQPEHYSKRAIRESAQAACVAMQEKSLGGRA
jgi:integrase